jgi:hypothetical protein
MSASEDTTEKLREISERLAHQAAVLLFVTRAMKVTDRTHALAIDVLDYIETQLWSDGGTLGGLAIELEKQQEAQPERPVLS